MCTKCQVDILKNDRVLLFSMSKKAIFHAVCFDLCFSNFQCVPNLGHSKSVLRSFFAFLTITDPKTCITPPKPRIFSLTYPWPRDLEWPWPSTCLRMLRMILRSVLYTIHVVVLTSFHFIRLWCATNPDTPNHQTSWVLPDLWLHQWPRGQQHLISLDKFSRSTELRLNFVNTTRSFCLLRGGDKKCPRYWARQKNALSVVL